MPAAFPELTVPDVSAFREWLQTNASTSPGVWLTLARKGTLEPTSLTMDQAVEEALCVGWINGQGRRRDDKTTTQRFQPRAAKSVWAKRNVGFVERLIAENRMQPAGLAAIESAKKDGRWDRAYAGGYPGDDEMPEYFTDAVGRSKKAQTTWNRLNKSSKYTVYFQLATLKTDAGRQKRTQHFIEMFERGEGPKSLTGSKSASSSTRQDPDAAQKDPKVAKKGKCKVKSESESQEESSLERSTDAMTEEEVLSQKQTRASKRRKA